jgi:hypothetical protein
MIEYRPYTPEENIAPVINRAANNTEGVDLICSHGLINCDFCITTQSLGAAYVGVCRELVALRTVSTLEEASALAFPKAAIEVFPDSELAHQYSGIVSQAHLSHGQKITTFFKRLRR